MCGIERKSLRIITDEDPANFRGGEAVSESGSDSRPGADPYIDVEIVEFNTFKSFLKGKYGADLVNDAKGTATRQCQSDGRTILTFTATFGLPVQHVGSLKFACSLIIETKKMT